MSLIPSRRRGRILVLCCVVLAVLCGVAGVYAYLITEDLESVERVEVVLPEAERPDPIAEVDGHRPVTFLVAGVDKQQTSTVSAGGEWVPGSQRSDSVFLATLSADRERVTVVSVPRDTLVDIPGYGQAKLNAAYSYGGPSLLVRTMEKFSGIRVDHLVVIDWAGFKDLTDALGGVEVYIPETVVDTYQDRTWHKGPVRLGGEDALAYVRQRHGLQQGDLDRIRRQQNFMRALMSKTLAEGLDTPMQARATVASIVDYLTVDEDLDVAGMVSLAWTVRSLRVQDVEFLTVPMDRFDYFDGQSVVIADADDTRDLFSAVASDRTGQWKADHPNQVLGRPGSVR